MNQPQHELERTQRWMQAVITHPQGAAAGIASADAQANLAVSVDELESIVEPSRARTSVQRLDVYANAYYARLLECMRELFPALAHALGQELFDAFACEYLQAYPSTSYTLARLADRFVDHLQQTRPVDVTNAAAGEDAADFFIDLARLEQAIDQVFDGPGIEDERPLDPQALLALSPDQWVESRLACAPCLRLLEFKFPVNRFYTEFRQQAEAPWPRAGASWLALSRRDYVVRRHELSRAQFDLLAALVAGQTVGEAIAFAAEASDDWTSLAADLQTWFRTWASAGFFLSIAPPA